MKEMREHGEAGSNMRFAGFLLFVILTTALAMTSSIWLYGMLLQEIISGLCIAIVLSIMYTVMSKPWITDRLPWFVAGHLVQMVLIIAGFDIPAVYLPICAIPFLLVMVTDVHTGVQALLFYSVLSVMYSMNTSEVLLLYLVYGLTACMAACFMRRWTGFVLIQTLLFVWYVGLYLLLQWTAYLQFETGFVSDGVKGAAVMTLAALVIFIFTKNEKKKIKVNPEDLRGKDSIGKILVEKSLIGKDSLEKDYKIRKSGIRSLHVVGFYLKRDVGTVSQNPKPKYRN